MDFTGLISQIYNIPQIIAWAGYLGLAIILFAETGLFFGFFLPGESLLVTAGIFAAAGKLNVLTLILFLVPAAIIGDAVGYTFGSRFGRKLYERKDSFFFRKDHLVAAETFYEKHGGKAVLLARFVPFVRTFAPIAAGIAQMPYTRFAMYNIAGAILWVISGVLLGFFLGKLVPNVDSYLVLIVGIVVLITLIPPAIGYLNHRKSQKP